MPVPFDTHAVVQQLEHLGFPPQQAEGLTTVLQQVLDSSITSLATKADLVEVRMALEVKLEALRGEVQSELKPLKWGMAVVVGGVLSLVLKTFLHL